MVWPLSNLREMLVKYSAPCVSFGLSREEISGSGMLDPYVVLMRLQYSDLHAAVCFPASGQCALLVYKLVAMHTEADGEFR